MPVKKHTQKTKDRIRKSVLALKYKHTLEARMRMTRAKTDNPKISGVNHPFWNGEKTNIDTKHAWVRYHKGSAKKCTNVNCQGKSKRFQWANVSQKYLRDLDDYIELCHLCHNIFDKGNHCKNGHEWKKENTRERFRVDKKYNKVWKFKYCLICKKEYEKNYYLTHVKDKYGKWHKR